MAISILLSYFSDKQDHKEELCHLGLNAVLLSEQFLTFQRLCVPSQHEEPLTQ